MIQKRELQSSTNVDISILFFNIDYICTNYYMVIFLL